MNLKYAVIIFTFLLTTAGFSQTQISLLNMDEVNHYLSLDYDQYKTINSKVVEIKTILEEDKKIIAELKERVKNGDEPGFFEKIGVKKGRDNRADDIVDLIEEIEDQLNDEQKKLFRKIEKPKLNNLSKEELFGKKN